MITHHHQVSEVGKQTALASIIIVFAAHKRSFWKSAGSTASRLSTRARFPHKQQQVIQQSIQQATKQATGTIATRQNQLDPLPYLTRRATTVRYFAELTKKGQTFLFQVQASHHNQSTHCRSNLFPNQKPYYQYECLWRHSRKRQHSRGGAQSPTTTSCAITTIANPASGSSSRGRRHCGTTAKAINAHSNGTTRRPDSFRIDGHNFHGIIATTSQRQ